MLARMLTICLCALILNGGAQEIEIEFADAPESYSYQSRHAISDAVYHLKKSAAAHVHGLVVQPEVTPTYKTEVRRFRSVEYRVKVPVYAYEYVQVTKVIGTGSERRAVESRERRRVGTQEYQEETRTRLEPDPDGDISQEVRVAVVDSQNLDEGIGITPGLLGYNAMALHTFLAVGLQTDDPQVRALKETLHTYLLSYGIPDTTFDVAWLTAAFCRWPERSPELDALRLQLLQKLLGGQVQENGGGMWGVFCLDYPVLYALIAQRASLNAALLEAQNKLKAAEQAGEERATDRARTQLLALQADDETWLELGRTLSWRAAGFPEAYAGKMLLRPRHDGGGRSAGFHDTLYPLRLEAHIPDMLRENTLDLECTLWALFALAEARAGGYLPKTLPRPSVGGKTFPPLDTQSAARAAVQSVLSSYDAKQRQWTLGHRHLIVNGGNIPGVETRTKPQQLRLQNDPTPMADAAAFQCLRQASRIVNLDDVHDKMDRVIAVLDERLAIAGREQAEQILDRKLDSSGRSPFVYLHALSGLDLEPGTWRLTRATSESVGRKLLAMQRPDGSWAEAGVSLLQTPPSLEAYYEARYLAATAGESESVRSKGYPRRFNWVITAPEPLSLHAVAFLRDSTWPAVIVHLSGAGLGARPVAIDRTLQELNAPGTGLTYLPVTSWPPVEISGDTPRIVAVTMTGSNTAIEADILTSLLTHLGDRGLLVVEAPARSAGQTAQAISTAGAALLGDARLVNLVESSDLLRDFADLPPIPGLQRPDGTVAVMVLPIAASRSAESLTVKDAATTLEAVLRARLQTWLLAPGFLLLDDDGNPFDAPAD